MAKLGAELTSGAGAENGAERAKHWVSGLSGAVSGGHGKRWSVSGGS
jgi:hypothetical protein